VRGGDPRPPQAAKEPCPAPHCMLRCCASAALFRRAPQQPARARGRASATQQAHVQAGQRHGRLPPVAAARRAWGI
jgi:hypothetical protein